MKKKYVWLVVPVFLILAGCPAAEDPAGPETLEQPEAEPVAYRVSVASTGGGTIRVKPESGAEGTVIWVQVTAEGEGGYFVPGSLSYTIAGGRTIPIDEGLMKFSLPAADVTVTARFIDMAELNRRMVLVRGAEVNVNTGTGPFAAAGSVPVEVPDFRIGAAEISFKLWYTVRLWAENDAPMGMKYTFSTSTGKSGSTDNTGSFLSRPESIHQYEPVVQVDWKAALVWCNAYSDWAREVKGENTQPVYKRGGTVIRSTSWTAPDPAPDPEASGYRLPTEAEWEFAARGGDPGDSTVWNYPYAGGNSPGELAWYRANSGVVTHAVGLKAPNSLGLYDMSGNAQEWCWEQAVQAVRGGFYNSNSDDVRVESRQAAGSGFVLTSVTIRVAGPPVEPGS
jgi:formylglycine-generating enzyme required for sulfatase activity